MRWFGEAWGAPVNLDTEQGPTPVGEPCSVCGVAIADGDRGILLPLFASADDPEPVRVLNGAQEVPEHLRCLLSEVLGPDLSERTLEHDQMWDTGLPPDIR